MEIEQALTRRRLRNSPAINYRDSSVCLGLSPSVQGIEHPLIGWAGEKGDMFAFGVINPAKVTRTALDNAASFAGMVAPQVEADILLAG